MHPICNIDRQCSMKYPNGSYIRLYEIKRKFAIEREKKEVLSFKKIESSHFY